MGFWFFILIMDLILPIILIVFGRLFMTSPPKEINDFYGYRTIMSKKNTETWIFAHKYCGKVWFWSGLVITPISIIPLFFVLKKSIVTISIVGSVVCIVQIIPMIISIILTEIALRKAFDKEGNHKTD